MGASADAARLFNAEIVHQTDVSGTGMAVVFWKEVYRQYQGKWRAPSAIMDPVARCVNSRIVEHEGLTNPECNWLMNIGFLAVRDAV
jgi:hypothetical protein